MRNKFFTIFGTLVMALALGLVLAACASGPGGLFGFGSGGATNGSGTNGPGTDEFQTRYTNNDHNELIIVKYIGRSDTVVIPAEFEGIPAVEIGEKAFFDNKILKSVTIPDSITAIAKDAFDNCAGLASIDIPASVIRIGADANSPEDAFDGCTGLTSITVAEANGIYSSEDGVLFNKDKTTLLLCPEGKSGSYTIPSPVTGVAYCAFEDCARLTSVTIPDNVTSIGELAFTECTGLTSITIPASVKVITGAIKNDNLYGAFIGCTGLTSVTISEGITSIGASAFFECTGLTSITIPDSVTYIGGNAFAACTELTSVTISPVEGRVWDFKGNVSGNVLTVYRIFQNCSRLNNAAKTALTRAGYSGSDGQF
jgi:hypothetical protein